MLRSDDFSSKAKVDRYGRRLPKDAGRKELERYYRIADEDEDGLIDDEDVEKELKRLDAEDEESESSSEEESEDGAASEEEEIFGMLDEQDGEEVPMGEVTSRIAVVNLDWDNIRAADLLAVFSSFAPSGGKILKVSIYPSEYGKERMEREEMEGPSKDMFSSRRSSGAPVNNRLSPDDLEEDELDDEEQEERIKKSMLKEDQGQDYSSASLRRYQLSRLRYFFAVLIFSSADAAEAVYNAIDGTEYLTTANFFDLRFVPDDTDFSSDKPRDECEKIPDGYRPNEFVTDALQHSKVRLTWDADDGARKEVQKRAFGGSRAQIDENDLKAYLGSDSEEEEDAPEPVVVDATAADDRPMDSTGTESGAVAAPQLSKKEAERQRMRALLGLPSEPIPKKAKGTASAPVGDLQITFTSGLSGNKGGVFENEPEPDHEETTVEKYIRKEKERKQRRKERMKSTRNLSNSTEQADRAGPVEDAGSAEQKDLGFDDPFFTDPAPSTKKPKKQHMQQRSPSPDSAAQRAQLETLASEDAAANADAVHHFDSNLLSKGEKLSKKKKHKHKLSERQREALEAREQDDFEINTQDPRFSAVFESSEFAIDPSHKGFKGTEGMKRLLEEGRKKRAVINHHEDVPGQPKAKKVKRIGK